MKAEERHRLHENELQRLTEHARLRSRPFIERYGTTLLFGLAGILLLIAAVIWWNKYRDADRGLGWSELSAVFRKPNATAEDFINVAELYPESKAGAWARLYAGEGYLESGLESLFTDREGAARDLADARENFENALASKDVSSELKVRALFGLAKTLETTSDGNLDPAIKSYRQVAEEYPGTAYEKLANDRLATLEAPGAKDFYAWFAQQKPSPTDRLQRPTDQGLFPGFPPLGEDGPALEGSTTPPEGSTTPPATAPESVEPVVAPKPTSGTSAPEESATGLEDQESTDTPSNNTSPPEGAVPAAEVESTSDPAETPPEQ